MIKLKITTTAEYESRPLLEKWLEAVKYTNAPYHEHIMRVITTGKAETYDTTTHAGKQTSLIELVDLPRDYKMPDGETDLEH